MAQSIYFSVKPEYYAQLTLDELVTALVQTQTQPNQSQLPPPLPQPMLDLSQGQMNTSDLKAFASQVSQSKASKPWLQWFLSLARSITSGTPASQTIEVLAPSIDETDTGWYGEASVGTGDPVTATVTLFGLTRFGIQLTITNAGSGYSGTVNITVASSNGNGHAAKGTAVLSAGKVVGWTQTTQGYDLIEPLVVTFSGGGGSNAAATATLGRQFAAGDYVIWNDPTITSSAYSYEIDQIKSITPTDDTHFSCTLTRAAPNAASGGAQYGSTIVSHTSAALFRLINKSWLLDVDSSAGPQILNFLWPNMCVAAVNVSQVGQTSGDVTVNLAPLPYLPGTSTPNPRLTPPSPGLRTMNGAAYTNLGILGTLNLAATSQARIPVQAWESIRAVYALVRTAPVGATTFNGDTNAAIVVYVCYISPGGLVGLIDTLVIDTTAFASYSSTNAPDGRQMPYHSKWQAVAPNADWPPNLLPNLTGALNASGNLQLGFSISTTVTVPFGPDGTIDFIVAQVGTSIAGANLTVVVQT